MIIQKSFLNRLKDFGLNTYEAKLWSALLSRGVSTAGELSDIADVPRSRTYDVLESLEKKGFIVMKIGKPIKYIAVPPIDVLDRVKKNIEVEANERIDMLTTLDSSDLLKELNLLHNQGIEMIDPSEITGSLKGRKNLYEHLLSMLKRAENNIIISTTEEGIIRKSSMLKLALAKLNKKGVQVKIATTITNNNKAFIRELKRYSEIKNIPDLNSRFVIIDDKEVLFMLVDDKVHHAYDSGVWVSTPYYVQSLSKMFNSYWNSSKE